MVVSFAHAQEQSRQAQPAQAEQLFALANQSRAQAGAGPLKWDPALAEAARKHCIRMAMEGPIAHRYGGEPDVSARAADAGAHFSVIEENVAVGSSAPSIHRGWLDSPGHRKNMLNPEVDHVGIAVVAARGVLYAVADYSRAVRVLSQSQVESAVGDLLGMSGISVRHDHTDARAACRLERGLPPIAGGGSPQFVMRWQGADLDHLPQELVDRLGSRRYHQAEVGSCPPRGDQQAFTQYRVAVLLY